MNPRLRDRITIEPGKCGGRTCIGGQRLRVTDIWGLPNSGASHKKILEDYPLLENDDILAALEYVRYKRITPYFLLHDPIGRQSAAFDSRPISIRKWCEMSTRPRHRSPSPAPSGMGLPGGRTVLDSKEDGRSGQEGST